MRIMQHLRNSLLRSEIISHLTVPSVRPAINHLPWRRGISRSLMGAPALLFLFLAVATAFSGSATWRLDPVDPNCNDCWTPNSPENWTPATVPDAPEDTATFDVSNITGVGISGIDIEVNGIVFNAGASPFTIAVA